MDIIRRNTDYALRLALLLAQRCKDGQVLSARVLAREASVPGPVTSKLLQKLQSSGIAASKMGSGGGFYLARPPEKISLLQIIEAVQGPINVNRCLLGDYKCPLKGRCPLNPKLKKVQTEIESVMSGLLLSELAREDKPLSKELKL